MPTRGALGPAERAMILEALDHYAARAEDPGYQGYFEERYLKAFVDSMGGGYADSVASGTAALFVALAALDLPRGAEILCSPITDPGTLAAITLNGLVPSLVDSGVRSYNLTPEQLAARITPRSRAVVVVHATGQAVDMDGVMALAERHGLLVVEDCSQAHGAQWRGRKVGTFGHVAAISTMYRKAHCTGGSGGLVYSRDEALFHRALAHADRGKPVWQEGFDWRDPRQFLFPALNLHTDELSSAMGLASLARLPQTIARRMAFVADFSGRLRTASRVCAATPYGTGDSPFILPVWVDADRLTCDTQAFAKAVLAEGIGLNPHYQYAAATWPFLWPYLADDFRTPNAIAACDQSFVLYVNENYGEAEAKDAVRAIVKVERHFSRQGNGDGD